MEIGTTHSSLNDLVVVQLICARALIIKNLAVDICGSDGNPVKG